MPTLLDLPDMTIKGVIYAIVLGWAIPAIIAIVGIVFTPDPNQSKADFPVERFTPTDVAMKRKIGSNRSDYYELWIHHPDGRGFYHRDPDREPMQALLDRIPRNVELAIVYRDTIEGDVLMGIARADSPGVTVHSV